MPSLFRSSLRSVSTCTTTTCRIPPRTRIVNCRSLKVILRSLKQTMGDLTLGNDIRGYFCRFGITTTASELTRRFVRFVSTPEILERVYTIESEIAQIEEAIAIQGNNSVGMSFVEENQIKHVESTEGNFERTDKKADYDVEVSGVEISPDLIEEASLLHSALLQLQVESV